MSKSEKAAMFLVILSDGTGGGIATSGVIAHLQDKYDLPLTIVTPPRTAAWFSSWPGRHWTLVLTDEDSRASEVQRSLYRRLSRTRPAAVADFGGHSFSRFLPARLLGGYNFSFYRRRDESLASALDRLRARLGEDLPPPCWRSGRKYLRNSHLARHSHALLPGGGTRPWVALSPGCAREDMKDEAYHDLWAQLSDVLFLPDGVLPGGRVVLLGAPGESESLSRVARVYLESLDDAYGAEVRVCNMVAQTSLAMAATCMMRSRLVVATNNLAPQLAAVSGVPCLRLLREGEDDDLPLWSNQARQLYPCSDGELRAALLRLLGTV
ncbi:MAG: hypothetical protein MPK03_04510 [Alphaproteobacteria bacterium]|nr:hypothetical protein [Alphaproteobacteria bacterium]